MTNEQQPQTMQMGLPPDLFEESERRSRAYQQQQRTKKLLIGAGAASALVATFAGGMWYADPSEAAPYATLPPVETVVAVQPTAAEQAETTTTIEATTTTSTTIARVCMTPLMEIQSGESLFGIASVCSVTLEQLLAFNPELTNPDDVPAGYQVRTAPPETTTTTVVETVPPTAPVEIPPPEIPLPETPTETTIAPPEAPPAPPEATAPVQPPNDGVLSEAECIAAGGKKYSFSEGETLMQYFKKIFGLTDVLAYRATKKPRIDELRLRQIYADVLTDDVNLQECVPLTTDGLL